MPNPSDRLKMRFFKVGSMLSIKSTLQRYNTRSRTDKNITALFTCLYTHSSHVSWYQFTGGALYHYYDELPTIKFSQSFFIFVFLLWVRSCVHLTIHQQPYHQPSTGNIHHQSSGPLAITTTAVAFTSHELHVMSQIKPWSLEPEHNIVSTRVVNDVDLEWSQDKEINQEHNTVSAAIVDDFDVEYSKDKETDFNLRSCTERNNSIDDEIFNQLNNLTSELVDFFFKNGSSQPSSNDFSIKCFPKNSSGRSFHENWYWKKSPSGEFTRRKWLSYFKLENSIYCHYCALFGRTGQTS
ncbi:hypothetical protein AGLY_016331 [Aphis glycines]|uniref:TTF-type domain-containing protein n=1 Tax=Aphis glycines TaxID=307491 RepID=A0A6G0SYD5_APHGL|nr:hypothetical protein AGLY_016331 [Aphis glycines]